MSKSLNSSKQCSVGIFVKDVCFLSTFVPVDYSIKSLESLSEDLRKTICYRTNMKTIPSICRHHLVAFSSRFSKFKQSSKCSNPLNIHGVGVSSRNIPKAGKRSISLELCEAIKCHRSDLHVYPGQNLCTTCVKELVKLKNMKIVKKSNTSSELEDFEEALASVFSDDNEVFSPLRPIFLSNQVTSTLQVTPVNLDPKKSNGGSKKQKLQKRLLLMNINELYVKYKEYCERILCLKSCGRSTFFMLRPCNVIEVGCSGSHNVCVYEKHQNVQLMVDTICGSNKEKKLLMDKIV